MVAAATGLTCSTARAAVTVLGVQYQQDELFPEYNCIWHDSNYPTSCSGTYLGGNAHVYLKNTGPSSVNITDVTLAGYSLTTILPVSATAHNANSIWFYWDNPPQNIIDAGIPVWFKGDPSTIPAGGVAQAVIRLRFPPTTPTVSVGVVTTDGTVNTTIPISASLPQLASVGFSQDRTKVYLHWRRPVGCCGSTGAAPTTILMDGVDVTSSTVSGGDPTVNFAESVLTLTTPLPYLSYHVFQGVYSDGKTATASLRAWSHEFLHCSWGVFPCADNDMACGKQFIDDSLNRGLNCVQNQFGGGVGDYLSSGAGEAYATSRGYGRIVWNKNTDNNPPPRLSFIDDEVDAEEDNVGDNFCGTGLRIPCGTSPMGILGMRSIADGESYRSTYPQTPTTINMDGTFKPENYYAYGQAVDVLQVDPYYQKRLKDTYWYYPQRIPLYNKATYNYAVAKAVTRAAEPNSSHVILQSTESKENVNGVTKTWPFATPPCKRIEAYYTLAGGAKGISYWWFTPTNAVGTSNGLGAQTPAAVAVWKEMGLYGNEIKTISPILVTSHPVDMTLTPSANVWARALASGTSTIILLAVIDSYYNDEAGFHSTPAVNANVVAALPSWMTAPTAFEIRPSGLYDVTTSLAGSNLTVQLGTLDVTKMIIITTDPTLRSTLQSRYVSEVWPGICAFAPEHCVPQSSPPSVTQHPSNQTVEIGAAAAFTVAANGSTPLEYQWQRCGAANCPAPVDLSDAGHYSGVTTATLTVSPADISDAGYYRCVVTNTYGSATSNAASLTVVPPSIPGDFDGDQDVDQMDFGHMQKCLDPAGGPALDPNCADADLNQDGDGDVDHADMLLFLNCMTRPGVAGDPNCAG